MRNALPYLRQCSVSQKVPFGKTHRNVAITLDLLAAEYTSHSSHLDYNEAESLYRQSLRIKEKVYGANHPKVADGINLILNCVSLTGKRTQEEELLYKRVLLIRQRAFGKNSSQAKEAMGWLASFYMQHKRYEEADELQRGIAATTKK